MELKAGYKQAEVGVIPEDWRVCGITDICMDIFLGLTTKVDYVQSNGVPLIRAKDINTGRLLFDEALQISKQQHQELTKYRRAEKGDILVSKSGTLGICALVDTDIEFSIYESIIVMKCDAETCDSRFLLWLMRFESTQYRLLEETVGSTVGHLNLLNFRKLVVPITKMEEQLAIVAALSDVDALITALDRLIAKKRNIKQAAMQELLTGKRRLPGFCNKWEAKRIRDIATIATGSTPPTKERSNYGEEYLFVSPVDLGKGKFIFTTEKRLSKAGFMISRQFPKGSILFTCIGSTIGKVGIAPVELTSNQQINAIFPSTNYLSDYLYYSLCLLAPKIRAMASEQAVPIINKAQFSNTIVMFPQLIEQIAITAILDDMDSEIAALEIRRDKTRALKQGMMQELLTGRIRLVQGAEA
jgi:type I restriction enzyme, S subunit